MGDTNVFFYVFFFANYLSPITIFVINLYKPLIDKEIV